jgi:NAD-dependent dihydropyrimidine dehydrogenase PreA subunit
MYQTLRPKRIDRPAKSLPDKIKPIQIDWHEQYFSAKITFSDGKTSIGSCIRCFHPFCVEYSPKELELSVFQDFPADKNSDVCPTSAISWTHETLSPVINKEACILCGLCVSRCPTRAIYLDNDGAYVNDEPNAHFILQNTPSDSETTAIITRLFQKVPEKGIYLFESDILMKKVREKVEGVAHTQSAQFPNHLARNLLIAVGIGAAMRRRGDTNIRMDLVLGPPGVKYGTGEVELGAEVLGAPRNILDNVAILVARYELSKDNIIPFVVSLDLPNLRSEYWQFIKDVKNVLDVKINSITIGALIVLTWSRAKILIRTGEEFYIDIDSPSLRPKIEKILGRTLNIKDAGYPGFLESSK